jgi:hypothetical protein
LLDSDSDLFSNEASPCTDYARKTEALLFQMKYPKQGSQLSYTWFSSLGQLSCRGI